MIVYCKESEQKVFLVAANIIAAQILKKPESVLGVMNYSEETKGIRRILMRWTEEGYVDFSQASLIDYEKSNSYLSDVDLLFVEVSKNSNFSRGYEVYQTCKEAETVLMVVKGKEQARMIKDIFESSVLSENPMAILREHECVMLVGDKEALSRLSKTGIWYE